MTIKSLLIVTLTIFLLTACSQFPVHTQVDRASLIRSMFYTHRHLLEIELGEQTQANENQRSLLLQSHCDLIRRGIVHADQPPAVCQSPAGDLVRQCVAEFHHCIGSCGTFKSNCPSCEYYADQCLDQADATAQGGTQPLAASSP